MRRSSLLSALLAAAGSASAAQAAEVPEQGNQITPVEVPAALLAEVHAALPEKQAVGQAYLAPMFDPNLVVGQRTSVDVTFISDGAAYRNSFGYFTYVPEGTGVRVLERGIVFPNTTSNSGSGTLQAGATATLRDSQGAVRYFEPGTHIGFFLLANAWNGSEVSGWNDANPEIPSTDPALNGSVFTSVDQLNPEVAAGKPGVSRHVAMIRSSGTAGFLEGKPYVLLGMEDVRRDQGSDNDFNDVVFVVHAPTFDGLSGTRVPSYSTTTGDLDGDGVAGLGDAFPSDPSRATIRPSFTAPGLPSTTTSTEEVFNGQGQLKDVQGTFHRSAGLGSATILLPGLPAEASGVVRVERFSGSGDHSMESQLPLSEVSQREADGTITLRLPEAFRSPAGSAGVESVRVLVTFDQAIHPDLPAAQARTSYPWKLDNTSGASAEAAPGAWLREWTVGVGQ